MPAGRLLSIPEAARLLSVSPDTVRRMIARHELEAVRLGGARHRPIRIPETEFRSAVAGWALTPEASAHDR